MDFSALAQQCAPLVDEVTIAAIVRTESSMNPLAINVNGDVTLTRQPRSKEEAIVTAESLLKKGHNIDVGLAQINSTNFKKLGKTVTQLFDPCTNLQAGASILQDNYARALRTHKDEQQALRAALSAYNTGSFTRGLKNGYVQKVVGVAYQGTQIKVPRIKTTKKGYPLPPTVAQALAKQNKPTAKRIKEQETSVNTSFIATSERTQPHFIYQADNGLRSDKGLTSNTNLKGRKKVWVKN